MTLEETQFDWRDALRYISEHAMSSSSYDDSISHLLAEHIERIESRSGLAQKKLAVVAQSVTKGETRKKKVAFRVTARTVSGPVKVYLFTTPTDAEWFEDLSGRSFKTGVTLHLRPADHERWSSEPESDVFEVVWEGWADGASAKAPELEEGDKRVTLRLLSFGHHVRGAFGFFAVHLFHEKKAKVYASVVRFMNELGGAVIAVLPTNSGHKWMAELVQRVRNEPARVVFRHEPDTGLFEPIATLPVRCDLASFKCDDLEPNCLVIDVEMPKDVSESSAMFTLLGERTVGWTEFE